MSLLSFCLGIGRFGTSAHRRSFFVFRNYQKTCEKMAQNSRTVTLDNMNPHLKAMEYAVRGPIVIRASEIEKELQQGISKPFQEVVKANIGDCHAMGQTPLTFLRQVVTLCSYPTLLEDSRFSESAKNRARRVLDACRGHSVGSYSDSPGLEVIRRDVATYIERRDGHSANYEDIMLCAGASDGIRNVMKILNYHGNGKMPGIMIPIPQYPLYTATIAEYNIYPIKYYLEEEKNWALNLDELKRSISEARGCCEPRAIVVINPGNPTGQVLTRENIEQIIKFAYSERLFIFADEVYQDNVYAKGSKFYSFKKVMLELGKPYSEMELASFMSASKGYMGECGLRGGYAEVINLDMEVRAVLNKSISAKLCPTVLGQAAMEAIVNTPMPNDPGYDNFIKEKEAVLASLSKRAQMIAETFNNAEGMTCNIVQGAMYAFPQITLPQKAIEKAKSLNQEPDMFWAMELLETTGICVVPGSGFGQRPGTYHFRTTILPDYEKLKTMATKLTEFHKKFLSQYK
uniref:alanine transaminase n=1 Tax=Hemiscolopendra marginata TaxID=943146 RepID=A0A646QDW4_9MYRI